MGEDRDTRDSYEVTVGNMSGQMVVGSDNRAIQVHGATPPPTAAEMESLRKAFAELRALVAAQAPADRRDDALGRTDELEKAITAGKPDLSAMEYLRGWFTRNVPKLAVAVATIFVHPVVGKLVQAAGDVMAGEFRRRFADPTIVG